MKIIDFYYKRPITSDLIFVAVIWIASSKFAFRSFAYPDKSDLLALLSSLIGTMISLAGFILAALTIIVTFKSSIKAKGLDEATNALELLFSSHHYIGIVNVFKYAIIEFVTYSIALYSVWQTYNNWSIAILSRIISCAIFVLAIVVSRSLYMLFSILTLENHGK